MSLPALRRRATSTAVLLASAVLVLAGCSSGSDPEPAASASSSASASTAPSAPADASLGTPATTSPAEIATAYCERLLPLDQVSELAGREMGSATVVPINATPGCTWSSTDESQTTVQAVNASSSTWGQSLPQIVDSLRTAGVDLDATTEADLKTTSEAVAQGFEPDADVVCEIFVGLAEATGYGSGKDATVSAVPDASAPSRVVGEACNADEYSLLQITGPDLADGLDDRLAETEKLLQQLHGAPLTFGTLG